MQRVMDKIVQISPAPNTAIVGYFEESGVLRTKRLHVIGIALGYVDDEGERVDVIDYLVHCESTMKPQILSDAMKLDFPEDADYVVADIDSIGSSVSQAAAKGRHAEGGAA